MDTASLGAKGQVQSEMHWVGMYKCVVPTIYLASSSCRMGQIVKMLRFHVLIFGSGSWINVNDLLAPYSKAFCEEASL